MTEAPSRSSQLQEAQREKWDVVVIGGGATGLGAAVEAASRGYRTLLLERDDFAKGTSSRSTKLVHGGVRYLQQMNLTLVTDALRERGYMLRNAPHIVHRLGFVVPVYSYAGLPYYGLGLKLYEWMSGHLSFGHSEMLSREETLRRLPTLAPAIDTGGLKGGIHYWDGQFDDARYAIALMRTLEDAGGIALNYVAVTELLHRNGRLEGVCVTDTETGQHFDVQARAVINATGVFAEQLLALDNQQSQSILSLSQGTHFVLSPDLLPSSDAMMVPRTADGRVLFAIPWRRHLLVGTTDVPVNETAVEPRASNEETVFLREHIHRYLGRRLFASDVLSVWAGMRPLVRSGGMNTARLARDHKVFVSPTGLVTVVGGKWTTYRRMGEDAVNRAAAFAGLASAPSRTKDLKLHGWIGPEPLAAMEEAERPYGADLPQVRALGDTEPAWNELLHAQLPYRRRDVVWAVRHEKARTVEDVLARRTRALFLNARAAIEAAPEVSRIVAAELERTEESRAKDLRRFLNIAEGYIYRD